MSRKILIAAGGTGGHIYPALAVAAALREQEPKVQIEFVGTATGLENKIIPPKGYPVFHLPIGRLNSNVPWTERLKTILSLPMALVRSWQILKARQPDFVLGVGGHASGPLLLVASLCGYRTGIWEPNAMPGMANRILARFVGECWVVFDEARVRLHSRNIHAAGMPVRREIENMAAQVQTSMRDFQVLVFGGSQGARGINNAVSAMVLDHREDLRGVHFVHQTGSVDFARLSEVYGDLAHTGRVDLREYLHDMEKQYAAADLVICRSGTGTLSELAACGKAAILVPLPTAADDHQRQNAESLVSQGAATMILQAELTPEKLWAEIQALRADPGRRAQMSQLIRTFHQPRAAEFLAGELLQRMESHALG